ncbi:MAG: hypothetical protein RM022_023475 [Nostoc sp. EfeVER01]|nr:hypothetical protein [Nostoc sp. EfeVER01]MDZ7948178.1 hypothetical protein [Nostoc sp. EfeVER01]
MSIVLASFKEKRRNFYPSIQAQTRNRKLARLVSMKPEVNTLEWKKCK